MVNETTVETFTDAEVLIVLRKKVKESSFRLVGSSFGVSGAYIHDVLKRRRGISEYIASQLGFELVPPPKPRPRRWTRKGE